jgi:hypothetical protein
MLACGIVILGVVPPDELRGADAVTAVTVPTFQVLLALRSYVVPLIVSVLLFGT